jgi:AhpD family alkylhydroperoxidase
MRPSPYALRSHYEAIETLQKLIDESGIDWQIADLCKTRASQLNGCVFCLAMHTEEARQRGESEARLHLLAAWRDAPCYSAPERAALALTEALTVLDADGVPDAVWDAAVEHLEEDGAVRLVWLIVAINAWNRLNVAAKTPPMHWKSELRSADR